MDESNGDNMAGHGEPRILVFRPTMKEFQDLSKYIEYMESKGAHKAGIAKVVPPQEWVPRKAGYSVIDDLKIPTLYRYHVSNNKRGVCQIHRNQKHPLNCMFLKDFIALANSNEYGTPRHSDPENIEKMFWKSFMIEPAPICGAVPGSLFDPDIKIWNIHHLGTVLNYVSGDYDSNSANITHLHFGMWRTTGSWDKADMYSISYMHFGAPKTWYAIPRGHELRMRRLADSVFGTDQKKADPNMMPIMSPEVLKRIAIPFNKITQEPGEFIVTFPFSSGWGFDHGFNSCEAIKFATERWIEFGKISSLCASLCQSREDVSSPKMYRTVGVQTSPKEFPPETSRALKADDEESEDLSLESPRQLNSNLCQATGKREEVSANRDDDDTMIVDAATVLPREQVNHEQSTVIREVVVGATFPIKQTASEPLVTMHTSLSDDEEEEYSLSRKRRRGQILMVDEETAEKMDGKDKLECSKNSAEKFGDIGRRTSLRKPTLRVSPEIDKSAEQAGCSDRSVRKPKRSSRQSGNRNRTEAQSDPASTLQPPTTSPHVCQICSKVFHSSNALRLHSKSHERGRPRPWECNECGARFAWKDNLRVHIRLHTGVKPYSCVFCGNRYTQSGTLKTHIRTHTGEKPFRCVECRDCFSTASILRDHKRVHTGIKSFSCSDCGSAHAMRRNLIRHKRIHQMGVGHKKTSDPEAEDSRV